MEINPFITKGYVSAEYFCDRVEETKELTSLLRNGNHVALISPRRIGKTGLICHCFQQEEIKERAYTFMVDIYATKSLPEFVYQLGKAVLGELKSKGRQRWETFIHTLASLRTGISFDFNGNPEWNIGIGDIKNPVTTLDEIFQFLREADKPCMIAIDEFQTITNYPEKNVEALLRTYIQHCTNATFIFSGSQRHMMSEIFASPSRPFYQSARMMSIGAIEISNYITFAQRHFSHTGKQIKAEAIVEIYNRFEGITWYLQSVLNVLYSMTNPHDTCGVEHVDQAVQQILDQQSFVYSSLLYQLPSKQKEVMMAICQEGKASNLTSAKFLKVHKLTASSVQAAVKSLLEKDFITNDMGSYSLYDRFFALWLLQQ